MTETTLNEISTLIARQNGKALLVLKEPADTGGLAGQRDLIRGVNEKYGIERIFLTGDSEKQGLFDKYVSSGQMPVELTEYLSSANARMSGEERYNHMLKILDYAHENNIPVQIVGSDSYHRDVKVEAQQIKESVGHEPDKPNIVLDNGINTELKGESALSSELSADYPGHTIAINDKGLSHTPETVVSPSTPAVSTPSSGQQQNLLLSIKPTTKPGLDTKIAAKQVANISEGYQGPDSIELDAKTIKAVRGAVPDLPEGKEGENIIKAGAATYMGGVSQEAIESAITQAPPLTDQETWVIHTIKKVNQSFYTGAPDTGNNLIRANDNPELTIYREYSSSPHSGNNFIIQQGKDIIFNKAKGKVTGAAKAATNKFINNTLQNGAKKVGKETVKAGAKKVGKETVKAGAKKVVGQVAGKGILAALGATGIGTIPALLIAAAMFVVGKIIGFVKKILKKIIPESLRTDSKKIAAAGLVGMGIGASLGIGAITAVGAGMLGLAVLKSPVGIAATIVGALALIIANFTAAAFGFIVWILVVMFGFIFLVVIIVYIMTVGAYVVPFSPYSLTTGSPVGPGYTSAYIDVVKTPSPSGGFENDALNGEGTLITYNISVSPRSGTLLVREMVYGCNTIKEGTNPECPPTDPSLPFSDIEFPFHINEGEAFNYSYTQRFTGNTFTDTGIRDTVTVTADADEQSGARQTASAYVTFGNPPDNCPEGWPIQEEWHELRVTQGPLATLTHATLEAFDVIMESGHTVTARHSGVATTYDYGARSYGRLVVITNICEGVQFQSYHAHLETISVTNGQSVDFGQTIGTTGDTGYAVCGNGQVCALEHIHYEFRNLPMTVPWIPTAIPYGCVGDTNCNTRIP